MYVGGSNREESLSRGTLFNDFTIRMDNRKSGRLKQVISTNEDGQYSVHWCYYCRQLKKMPLNILRIAHFRKVVRCNDTTEVSNGLRIYTPALQKTLKSI